MTTLGILLLAIILMAAVLFKSYKTDGSAKTGSESRDDFFASSTSMWFGNDINHLTKGTAC